MKILLIDDDVDICMLTQKVLEKYGYHVDAFHDAQIGVKHAMQNKPDLILMDIMLPGLSGPEVVSSLKMYSLFKDVPVVFLTSLVSGEEQGVENEGIMAGGTKYPTLGKPYEIERLLAVVKKYAK